MATAFFMRSSYHNCMATTARVAGAFDASLGKTPRRMHAAEVEIFIGPDRGIRSNLEDLLGAAEARLEMHRAAFLDMKTRGFNRIFQAHAEVEEIHRDLQDRRANAVRAASAKRGDATVAPKNDGRRHHRGEACTLAPLTETVRHKIFFAEHVVQHEAKFAYDVTVAFAIGDAGRGGVAFSVDDAHMGRAAMARRMT